MQANPSHYRQLHPDSILCGLVQQLLRKCWSPQQISVTLARVYPKVHEHRVSTETIYNCIYTMPVGELRRELIACLRQAHNKRLPRSKGQDRRGKIPDMLSIHVRPPEIEDRQFPWHREGDLIKGEGSASAANALQAFTDKLLGISVYFCDPHSPWQRGSNENVNGLVRQYLLKGTLSIYSQEQLDAIADEINERPRKELGVRSPLGPTEMC